MSVHLERKLPGPHDPWQAMRCKPTPLLYEAHTLAFTININIKGHHSNMFKDHYHVS